MIKLVLADDHRIFLDGLSSLLSSEFEICGLAGNAEQLIQHIELYQPDVVLLDIDFGEDDGIEVCKRIAEQYPQTRVLALTMYNDGIFVKKMIDAGAKGYLLKESPKEELTRAIHALHNNQTYFSQKASTSLLETLTEIKRVDRQKSELKISSREKEVLQLIIKECTTEEIAEALFISKHTVETHRGNLIAKMDVKNVAGLVRKAMELNLLDM